MGQLKGYSDYQYENYIKNNNQIVKLFNELKSINDIIIDVSFNNYKECKHFCLLIDLKLNFDYSIKDDYERVYNYSLKEKQLMKNILNIIKNNNFKLADPLEKQGDGIYYLVVIKSK